MPENRKDPQDLQGAANQYLSPRIMSREAKIALIAVLLFWCCYGLLLTVWHWMLSPWFTLLTMGLMLSMLGVFEYLRSAGNVAAAQVKLGGFQLSLSSRLILLVLGLSSMGYGAFLHSKEFWAFLLREESIEDRVALLVPHAYRAVLLRAETEVTKPRSKEELLLEKAVLLYQQDEYEACHKTLRQIATQDNNLMEQIIFYSLMSQYHNLVMKMRRLEPVSQDEISSVELQFKQFLQKKRDSVHFCTIHYWLGHFYLQVCRDPDKALGIFDQIIKDFAYSSWLQGSLYYSAILHHNRGTDPDNQRALENLRILAREDGLLKIVEMNRTVDGSAAAQSLLESWEVRSERNARHTGSVTSPGSPENLDNFGDNKQGDSREKD